ncbi:MAG: rhomboid family intramembrane serine protease [Bacteroidetes bacterium]|nr:MAG: rhomboid family intramembrane serine protease [Bacteroidota bacterium]
MEITSSIIAVTILVSVLGFYNENLFSRSKFNPYDVKHSGQWYRFFTYGFLHAGWVHLGINMIVLYSFGVMVEKAYHYYFQSKYILYFLLLYMGALLLSVIPAFGKHKNDVFYSSVGASGAVSAIVFASIIIAPLQKIYLFFIPIGIPAILFGILYLVYEYWMSRRAKDNIGHDAHLWGAIFGLIFTIAMKPVIVLYFLRQLGFDVNI